MKKLPTYLLILFLATSCGEGKVKHEINSSPTSNNLSADRDFKTKEIKTDTKALTIREYGQKIINDEIQPSDNNQTFACLDSIDDDNPNTRRFFFQVYRVIAKESDGALGEVVGGYTKSYLQTFSAEALGNFKNLGLPEQKLFIDNLAFEFYASGTDYEADIESYFASIYNSCDNCKADKATIEKIKSDLIVLVSKMND